MFFVIIIQPCCPSFCKYTSTIYLHTHTFTYGRRTTTVREDFFTRVHTIYTICTYISKFVLEHIFANERVNECEPRLTIASERMHF